MSNVAEIIAKQIGRQALVMIGAKNARAGKASLTITIGKNAKKVTTVHVELMPRDTYTVSFWSIRGASMKLISQVHDVYADSLNDVIASNTGLYVSL